MFERVLLGFGKTRAMAATLTLTASGALDLDAVQNTGIGVEFGDRSSRTATVDNLAHRTGGTL